MFRLNVVELEVPALKDRREDVMPLAEKFLGRFAAEENAPSDPELTAEARAALQRHDWPGNVRELENRIQRAIVVAASPAISSSDLGFANEISRPPRTDRPVLSVDDTMEREQLKEVLSAADGVVARAAEVLGISRQALYRKMSRYGIELERRLKP